MYGFDDDDEPGRTRLLGIAAAGIVVAAAIGWFVLRPALADDDSESAVQSPAEGVLVFDSAVLSATGSTDFTGTAVPTTEPDESVVTTALATEVAATAEPATAVTTDPSDITEVLEVEESLGSTTAGAGAPETTGATGISGSTEPADGTGVSGSTDRAGTTELAESADVTDTTRGPTPPRSLTHHDPRRRRRRPMRRTKPQ